MVLRGDNPPHTKMKKTYYISSLGYTIHPQDPGFPNIIEARKAMAEMIKESKQSAKNRWKRAAIIRNGKDRVAIHAMKHKESPLWAEFTITSF